MDYQPMVVTQPQVVLTVQSNRTYWQTDLCDCCSDCGVCLCGMFCFPCLAGQVASDMNECCCCGATVAMRAVYRTKYNIPVSRLPCLDEINFS
uniref:Placenta associated 8 n=1 Tax=Pseudonaja textilis TaxID=8673 RepID=A0A670Z9A1_PSETE